MSGALLGLLHQGGWDEMLMVGVGLLLAYVVITVTRRRDEPSEGQEEAEDVSVQGRPDEPSGT